MVITGSEDNPQVTDFRALPLDEMQAILFRFEDRTQAALRAKPATKEWVRKALRRQGAQRCPARLRRLSVDVILRYGDDLAESP